MLLAIANVFEGLWNAVKSGERIEEGKVIFAFIEGFVPEIMRIWLGSCEGANSKFEEETCSSSFGSSGGLFILNNIEEKEGEEFSVNFPRKSIVVVALFIK